MGCDVVIRIVSHIAETKTARYAKRPVLESSPAIVWSWIAKDIYHQPQMLIDHQPQSWLFDFWVEICALTCSFTVHNSTQHERSIIWRFQDFEKKIVCKNVSNDILCSIVVQTIENIIFKMAVDGHFEFEALAELANIFARAWGLNSYLTFIEVKSTEKRTFALHGHGITVSVAGDQAARLWPDMVRWITTHILQ